MERYSSKVVALAGLPDIMIHTLFHADFECLASAIEIEAGYGRPSGEDAGRRRWGLAGCDD